MSNARIDEYKMNFSDLWMASMAFSCCDGGVATGGRGGRGELGGKDPDDAMAATVGRGTSEAGVCDAAEKSI